MISDGEVTKIYCETQGDPKPSVVWEVGGSRFPEQVHSGNSTGYVYYNVSENGSLVVTNPRSSKRYGPVNVTCIANNSAGIARRTFKVVFLKSKFVILSLLSIRKSCHYSSIDTTGVFISDLLETLKI